MSSVLDIAENSQLAKLCMLLLTSTLENDKIVYHMVKHGLSYNSTDCLVMLLRKGVLRLKKKLVTGRVFGYQTRQLMEKLAAWTFVLTLVCPSAAWSGVQKTCLARPAGRNPSGAGGQSWSASDHSLSLRIIQLTLLLCFYPVKPADVYYFSGPCRKMKSVVL